MLGTAAKDNRIIFILQFLRGHVHSYIDAGFEYDAFLLHQLSTSFNHLFIQFHIRNAVHQQTAHPVIALEYRHAVASVIQLIGDSQSGRAAADNRDAPSAADSRNHRLNIALGKG